MLRQGTSELRAETSPDEVLQFGVQKRASGGSCLIKVDLPDMKIHISRPKISKNIRPGALSPEGTVSNALGGALDILALVLNTLKGPRMAFLNYLQGC